ncbi:hypothetical protein SG34_007755 [Thalassomonas viridans]|uniref:Uncharacterized protein n=1 Tax=Thalassomonas viridans TaxID=137584 RepID=A0AAE9Z802_9GAMM|nr:hypothetical protein [Thalassomonas viridans]WDE08455.1 hypothetical protein SG34_007755 [Thalassomonas viridans]
MKISNTCIKYIHLIMIKNLSKLLGYYLVTESVNVNYLILIVSKRGNAMGCCGGCGGEGHQPEKKQETEEKSESSQEE